MPLSVALERTGYAKYYALNSDGGEIYLLNWFGDKNAMIPTRGLFW